jgi:hypothetical protein
MAFGIPAAGHIRSIPLVVSKEPIAINLFHSEHIAYNIVSQKEWFTMAAVYRNGVNSVCFIVCELDGINDIHSLHSFLLTQRQTHL